MHRTPIEQYMGRHESRPHPSGARSCTRSPLQGTTLEQAVALPLEIAERRPMLVGLPRAYRGRTTAFAWFEDRDLPAALSRLLTAETIALRARKSVSVASSRAIPRTAVSAILQTIALPTELPRRVPERFQQWSPRPLLSGLVSNGGDHSFRPFSYFPTYFERAVR